MMTWNALQQFYLDNSQDIEALLELRKRARRDIPLQVRAGIRDALAASIQEWRGFDAGSYAKCQDDKYGAGVWWCDGNYNEPRDAGFYYGLYPLSDVLLSDEPKVYMHFYIGKRTIKEAQTLARNALIELAGKSSRIRFGDPWDERSYPATAYQDVSCLVRFDDMKDWSKWLSAVVSAARLFSETVADVLPEV